MESVAAVDNVAVAVAVAVAAAAAAGCRASGRWDCSRQAWSRKADVFVEWYAINIIADMRMSKRKKWL